MMCVGLGGREDHWMKKERLFFEVLNGIICVVKGGKGKG